jgi:hypothetical protein
LANEFLVDADDVRERMDFDWGEGGFDTDDVDDVVATEGIDDTDGPRGRVWLSRGTARSAFDLGRITAGQASSLVWVLSAIGGFWNALMRAMVRRNRCSGIQGAAKNL